MALLTRSADATSPLLHAAVFRRYATGPVTTAKSPNLLLLHRFPPDQRYLVGVSGGRDSIALLHLLTASGYANIVVCHLNHQLRGRSSSADARFVARTAERAAVRYEIGEADVAALAKRERISIELAGRRARHAFFAKCARKYRTNKIFLGHHADDLVETFLLNLFRGSGAAGLSSLREVHPIQVNGTELLIARPLLHVWRKEIDGYVRRERITFREDASNRDLQPARNRLRHRVIPYLEKTLGRDIRQNIWRAALIAGEEDRELGALVPKQLAASGPLTLKPLRALSVAVQRRALRDWLRASGVSDIGFDLIERVRDLLEPSGRVAKTNLPRDHHVRRRAGKLFIE